jgi:hypothetical protein
MVFFGPSLHLGRFEIVCRRVGQVPLVVHSLTVGGDAPSMRAASPRWSASALRLVIQSLSLEAHMPVWMETATNMFVGALTLMLVVKYRDRGVLKWIGESKLRFRAWLTGKPR